MRIKQRLYSIAIIIVVAIIFFLLILSQRARSISAEALVSQIKDDGALLQADEVIYSKWRVTQRIKPTTFNKLTDPYHLSPEPEVAAFTTHRWAQKLKDGRVRWIARSLDDKEVLIEATSFDNNLVKYYDRASDVVVLSTISEQSSSAPVSAFNPQVIGSTDTLFGPAWIVLLYSDKVTSDMGDATPYYADLQPEFYERIAFIQKETMRVVQWVTQIRTRQGGTVLIKTEVLEASNVKQSSADDASIFQFDAPTGTTEVDQDLPSAAIPGNKWNTISDAQAALPFGLIVPHEAKANVVFQSINGTLLPTTQAHVEKRIFDIQDAARNGEAIEIQYLSADAQGSSDCIETANACSKKTLVIIEGPGNTLSPKMKRQRLLWDESRLVQVQLVDRRIHGYIATGGAFQQADQIAFFAEVDDTFICIIGQHYTEQELLAVLATLQQAQ